jgi:C4-dicarboxylate-specific signal transduction histidine kinase
MNSNEAIQLIVQDSGTMPDPTGGTANVTGQRSIAGALHGAQARLASALQLTIMEELAASIAHEITQQGHCAGA